MIDSKEFVYIISCELNSKNEHHSYILGAFTDESSDANKVKDIANKHYLSRAGKYKIIIFKCELNNVDLDGCEVVYEIDR